MKSNPSENVPQLQKPGAGLPLLERIFLRFYIGPFIASKAEWSKLRFGFEKIYSDIWKKTEGLDESVFSKPVLVPRLKGLEDSSRYWSMSMVLEHLVIVGEKIEKLIIELSHGRIPDAKVDIAKVKPLGKMPAKQVREQYFNFFSKLPERLEANMGDWNHSAKFVHPWFGPVRCNQWAWLLVSHGAVHRAQLREILKKLN